jgi:6,7-dimethyl-8-ribityllumazine synthase
MSFAPDPPHLLIVSGEFYQHIAAELVAGATEALSAAGATWDKVEVPGAFEIPAVISAAERASHRPAGRRYDGFVALGCVIRGETSHYDYVCGESARALMDLAVSGLAIGYGILTTENEAQAMARARRSEKNKGADAANAALAMIGVRRTLNMGGALPG